MLQSSTVTTAINCILWLRLVPSWWLQICSSWTTKELGDWWFYMSILLNGHHQPAAVGIALASQTSDTGSVANSGPHYRSLTWLWVPRMQEILWNLEEKTGNQWRNHPRKIQCNPEKKTDIHPRSHGNPMEIPWIGALTLVGVSWPSPCAVLAPMRAGQPWSLVTSPFGATIFHTHESHVEIIRIAS